MIIKTKSYRKIFNFLFSKKLYEYVGIFQPNSSSRISTIPRCIYNVEKIHKNALCCLKTTTNYISKAGKYLPSKLELCANLEPVFCFVLYNPLFHIIESY